MHNKIYIKINKGKKLEVPIEEFYSSIGKVSVEFEFLMALAKAAFYNLAQPINDSVFDLLTKDMNTKSLIESLSALINQKNQDNIYDSEIKLIDSFLDTVKRMVAKRNEFIHGLWVVTQGEGGYISGSKLKMRSKSLELIDLDYEKIPLLVNSMRNAKSIFLLISSGYPFNNDKPLYFNENYIKKLAEF